MKCITPLPIEFRFQLRDPSSKLVFEILLSFRSVDVKLVRITLSCFTPNHHPEPSLLPYYRSCWHEIGWSFFSEYRLNSSSVKEVYSQMTFFPHAILLDQAFAHCPIFPTAGLNKPGPCFSSGVAILPLRMTKDLRFGKLLSHQHT